MERMCVAVSLLVALRTRGVDAGGAAVVGVAVRPEPGGNFLVLSGTAVRFVDPTHGRDFDVVGSIDVEAPVGEESKACDELQHRMLDLHADMVTRVLYDAGDLATRMHVRADAIRFRRSA